MCLLTANGEPSFSFSQYCAFSCQKPGLYLSSGRSMPSCLAQSLFSLSKRCPLCFQCGRPPLSKS